MSQSTFTQAIGVSNVVAIATGLDHQLALRSDGLVFGCGYNNYGQLGINTAVSKTTFLQVTSISNVVAIAAGDSHSVALRSDGLVFACGENSQGACGIGNHTVSILTFVQCVGISQAVAVGSTQSNSFALRSDGKLFGTGSNSQGTVADGTATNRSSYTQSLFP